MTNKEGVVDAGSGKEAQTKINVESDSNASFLRAARAGNVEKVLEYLKGSIDINTCNANGLNALHLASKEGHVAVVQELVKRGANVNIATKKGNTALHIASLAGQEEVVKILVQNGANVNLQSQNGFTPLYMAAQENHDGVVKFLLANNANQSLATEDGFTPLAVALQQGHDKVVAVLLENDAKGRVRLPALHIAAKKDDCKAAALLLQNDHDPDVTSKSGFTPLHIAAHYGNENIATLLLEKNADVNYSAKHQITPLHVAAKWGKSNMVNLLIDKGAKIDASTRDGLTPLHCAARSGHDQVVDLLLEKGAPITAKTKNGLAPLHMASQGDHVDSARILLYHKAPVDDVTVDYLTALHVAAHCGHVRVAKLLLDRKADPNARALNGFTPLHIACKKNRIKVVELLLKHGASIEATTESGLTPLHVASFMGCMNIVIYLIQHGANADVPTVRGETPLHLAARANQSDIIRILLRNGAHVDASAREHQTPLHIAARLGNVDIVGLLLQHGAAVDATTKDMYTALHIAAKEGQEEVASVLLDHNASLTATTKKGFTPLHLAAKYGNIKVARLLLQKDAPVDAQGKNGVTPLHVAAHYDHVNVALLLLDKGAFPHATAKNGYTPLHIAAKKNQMDIATTLLEYGAKPNAESKAGFTPLHLAAQEGHTDMTALLIEHHADVNAAAKNGLSPLHLCAQEDKVNVAAILVKNGAKIDPPTKAGYTPLHVACHFGQINMIRFLLQHKADVHATTSHGYTPLHQAAQQGHTLIINLLLEHKASPNTTTNQGQTALSIAQRLGYISVVETLKIVTETIVTTTTTTITEEKYKVVAPETMQETFMSDSEDEGGDDIEDTSLYGKPAHATHVYLPYIEGQKLMTEDTMLGDQSLHYMTTDELKALADDNTLGIDVTRDERGTDSTLIAPLTAEEDHLTPQHVVHQETTLSSTMATDNVDLGRAPVHAGKLKWKTFLVSFMVDARGGAMRGCRHSGVRVIIPPRKAPMPMRITCRYLRKEKLAYPPPLMEGEACASRILEVGPSGAKFLGPVIIEVPHFASLRGREREITILRSDNGESWREHTLEASDDAVHDVFNESFEGEELTAIEDLSTNRITRILTTDFPQYFAIITRIRQEVHAIGPEGGMVSSTVVPQVQAIFPEGALTKKIKVGLQAQPITPELVTKLLGNRVAVSPIVTVEPRRRKFHKPITLTIPVPQAATKGMINQYSGDAPTLRLLCSITGGTIKAQWEDVTGSTPLTFVNDCVSFTTTVSARFWLIDCRQVNEATKFATELYREAIHVPFMAKFVVFAKRRDPLEAQLRVFCMTDDKEDKTLESQEHFTEVAKSRDVEVLEGKLQYLEFAGNLVPVTKSGEQLSLTFQAFRENRLPFTIRVKDPHQEPMGRVAFMREPRVGRGEPPQSPICNLNIVLPEADPTPVSELVTLEKKYGFVTETSLAKPELIHRADLRLSDIAKELRDDWISLALQLDVPESDINTIKSENPNDTSQQALVMLRHWLQRAGSKATGNFLEKGLRKINREDIVNQCMFNVELVTDDVEKAVAKVHLDQSGFDTFKEELGSSRDASLRRETSLNGTYDEQDIMKDAESAAETSSESSDKEAHFRSEARHHDLGMERRTDSENFTRSSKGYDEGPETLVQTVPTALAESFTQNMVNGQLSDTSFHEEDRSEPTVATLSSEATAEMEISSLEDKSQTETHVEKKEWTETDDSGSIRQITQIKTETSIKLEGDGAVKSLKKTPKKEDSDEEKKSSTDSEKEDLSFTEKKSFFQRLSLTSDSLPVNSKWTQDVSLDDLPMAEGEIIQEQISFEDKLKMFEPDEDNRKKIQKRDKSEQPTVYRYDFTKPAKERPVATEFVVSELEKAEEIVKQVSEELNVEENLLNDQNFNLNDKTTDNESDVDSAFTLERVEQEVSSLLAEVDREEKELSNDFHHISSSQVDSNMSTRDSHLSAIRSGSQETENSDFAALSFDSAPKSPVLTEEPCTYIEADVSMQEGEKVTILESDVYKDEKSVDPERCVEVESLAFQLETEEVSETDVPPVVEFPGSAHDQHAHHSLSSGDIRVSSVSDEEYTERKLIVDLYKKEEFKEAVKLDEDDSVRDTVKHSQEKPSNLMDISSTVDSHIKSEILREEIDLSIEESPLEVKQIAEDLEHISASEDRKCPVYQHIRTEILTQALGEDIECGSPERKELGTFSLKKSDLSEISGRTTQESSSEISNDKQNNLTRKISPQVSEESAGPTDDISSSEGITVEQDEHLVDYEEAREEHSLTEQLQALASDSLLASKGLMQDVYQTLDFGSHDFDHMSSGMSSSMPDVDIPRRGKDVYSRPDKKDIRSLKSTKQVSTIEEHSSIESCDSPQEMALQDLPEKADLKGSSSDEEHKDKSQDLSSQEMFIADSNQIKTHVVAELDVNAGFELPSEKKGTTVEEKLLDTDFLDDPGLLSRKSDSFDESRKLPRSESKSSHGKKSDSDAEGSKIESITESAGKRKEESFSSSGETESPYYSVETSDSGRTPRSTPAASRPCSSEFEINVFSGHGSEYETCVTSQEASGSYATAISSQEISYATACSSFSHSSRESAYSVDSESSGHLASVEVSSEASETLVPSAQEMELEFGPDLEMPVLDEEPANYDSLKEPYDMKIPESVIRSGIELPFMKTWDFRDTAPDEKMKQLPQQWTWQYATESEISDKFEVIENNGSIPIDTEIASSATEVHAIEEGVHFSTSVAYTTPSFTQVETGSSSRDIPYHRRSVSSVMDIVLDQERIEQTNSVLDEEQLSVSESSATHSEQTWQTSTDTAVQLSYNAPSSCLAPDSPNFVAASDSCQENLEEALTPEHSFISHPETSYLQLNGPVEVDYNPDYDNLDGDNSQPVSIQNQLYETDGLQFDLEIEGSSAISSDAAGQHTSGVNSQSVGDMGSKNNESTSCHTQPSSDYDTQNGRSLDAEKPEAQQEQSFSFSGYSSHRASESRVCPDLTSYLPESDQCDLLPGGIDSLPPSYESEINIPCGESVSSTEAMPTLGTGSQLLPDLQSTDSLERTDIVDTSPEDERYEYKSHKTAATGKSSKDEKTSDAQSASSSVKCDEGDILAESDCVSQVYTSKYDEISGTDLYTHHEEEEFELRESDVYPSPIPSIEEDKQSTPSFDVHPSRRFFPRSGDTSASSSLQEFERLEAEIVAGRLSRSSVDSSEKMAFTKSGEHDDISMSSLTEFEKLEKECVENEPLDRIGVDDVMLSEIEEGLESQSSDVLEILPSSLHDGSDSEYEKRRIDFEEIIKVAQTNVEKFQEETVSEGVTSDECTVLMRVLSETQDTSEGNKVSSKDEATDIEESEPFPPATDVDNLAGGHDSSSSGEKMCGNGKLDCMISSTDSIDPSSSTATHATYQFETDSVVSSSINSAQASGEECTMVSSTDTLEPEPKLTYSIGDTVTDEKTQVSSNVDEPLTKGALACKLEELQDLQSANGAKEQMELFLSKLTDESVLMEDYPSHSFTDIKEDSKPLRTSDDLLKTFEAGHGLSASGDSSALDGEDLVSRTTATTTTRIVTTVTTDQNDGSGQEQQTADDSEDLRHSVEVILNQFMSDDSSGIKLEDSSIEHDE